MCLGAQPILSSRGLLEAGIVTGGFCAGADLLPSGFPERSFHALCWI